MNARKEQYRMFFRSVITYVKMTVILREMGLTNANFSRFLKSSEYDWTMSVDLLERIKKQTIYKLKSLT